MTSSQVRSVERKSEEKEAPTYTSSAVDEALTMRKKRHVWEPRLRHRELSESRDGPARLAKKSSPLDQTALLVSAHHVATDLHRYLSP